MLLLVISGTIAVAVTVDTNTILSPVLVTVLFTLPKASAPVIYNKPALVPLVIIMPAALLFVRFNKVSPANMPPAIVCVVAPAKSSVPFFISSVPLLVIMPVIRSVAAVTVKDAFEAIVRLLHITTAVITGLFLTALITTFVVAAGTMPPHQLFGSVQLVLLLPVHTPPILVGNRLVYAVAEQPVTVTCKV